MTIFLTAAEGADKGGFPHISAPWVAVIGTVFGGVVLKIAEHYINKPSRRDSTPAELREELRTQIEGLKSDVARQQSEIDATEKEMLEWRDKYYKMVTEQIVVQRQMADYVSEISKLREQIQNKEVEKNGN